jgi:hypothetical protein
MTNNLGLKILGRKPRILTWDIESTDLEITKTQYGLKNYIKYDNPDNITRDWTLLGASVKWHGEASQCISVSPKNPFNDEYVTHWLHEKLSQADMIVGHNSKRFDYKKFNVRAIKYGLDPVFFPPRMNYDTLTVARRMFGFTSNKLSYLANFLGIEAKDESPDWNKCKEGCQQELAYMREYNKKDVIVTEQIYDKLAPWDHLHPDLSYISNIRDSAGEEVSVCLKCQSPNLKFKNWEYGRGKTTRGKKKKRYICGDCGVSKTSDKWINENQGEENGIY